MRCADGSRETDRVMEPDPSQSTVQERDEARTANRGGVSFLCADGPGPLSPSTGPGAAASAEVVVTRHGRRHG